MNKQLSFIEKTDPRPPETVTWNLWRGCSRVSAGCKYCYMFRKAETVGRNPKEVVKNKCFNLPTRILRSGPCKGLYKIPPRSVIFTCFTSDFFHVAADEWRSEAWDTIRERSDCTFFMITKRPERILKNLPSDWGEGWNHVTIAVTVENYRIADQRLPVYLSLPLKHRSIMVEPMLSRVNLRPYLSTGLIESVSAGGESGPEARVCDYGWILHLHMQCVEYGVSFSYHQTGARLIKGGKEYSIPRNCQHEQAHKAHLDYDGSRLLAFKPHTMPSE